MNGFKLYGSSSLDFYFLYGAYNWDISNTATSRLSLLSILMESGSAKRDNSCSAVSNLRINKGIRSVLVPERDRRVGM